MKNKKYWVWTLSLVIILLAIHLIPVSSRNKTICPEYDSKTSFRIILGQKAQYDKTASLQNQDFCIGHSCMGCSPPAPQAVNIKLYIL